MIEMKYDDSIQLTVSAIERLQKLYQDFLIFRYVNKFSNEDIGKLLDFSKEEINRIFLCAELIIRLTVEKDEPIDLSDEVIKEAAEIVLKNRAKLYPDDGDYDEWQPSEEFIRKIQAIYMDESSEE